jgi:outer membrane protein assembly factor BamB
MQRSFRVTSRAVIASALTVGGWSLVATTSSADGMRTGQLSITDIAPDQAVAGQKVVVRGADLNGVTSVLIHGIPAAFTIASDSTLTVIVPRAATTGPLDVVSSTGSSAGPALRVRPTVSTFAPTRASAGTTVTISGTSFASPCTAFFGAIRSTSCTVTSATSIRAIVPKRASGPIRIDSSHASATSRISFPMAQSLTLSPTQGPALSAFQVKGSGYKSHEAVDVYVGAVEVGVFAANSAGDFSSVGLAIPASAQPGSVAVTAIGRISEEGAQNTFTVDAPSVVVTPGNGAAGSSFTLSGSGFEKEEVVDVTVGSTQVGGPMLTGLFGLVVESGLEIPSGTPPGAILVSVTVQGTDISANAYINVGTDWPELGFNGAHTAYNPGENVLGPTDVGSLAETWGVKSSASLVASPADVGGIVVEASTNGDLDTYNGSTGALLEQYNAGAPIVSSPAVVNGIVYVGLEATDVEGGIVAVNEFTGKLVWSVPFPGSASSSPTVSNGIVYIGTDEGAEYGLRASNGQEVFGFGTESSPITGSTSVVNNVAYFGAQNGYAYAINATTGTLVWQVAMGSPIDSTPVVANGVAFFADDGGSVFALSSSSGAQEWATITNGTTASALAVANGVVFDDVDGETLFALSEWTGDVLWQFTTGDVSPYPLSGADGQFDSTPAVANGVVYVGSCGDLFYALNAATGSELWSYTTGGQIEASPAISNGMVYVSSYDNWLYAFGLASP